MKAWIVVAALLCSGCTAAISQEVPPVSPVPEVITGEQLGADQRKLTLRLTLSTPSDLLVREGDRITEGQILADRVRDRARLESQLERLNLQISKLSDGSIAPPPPRQVAELAGLPPANFLSETAEIERHRLLIEAAERNREDQQRLLDMLVAQRGIDPDIIAHETVVLEKRTQERDQAISNHQLAQAKLAQAQNERQFEEYRHSIAVSNRQLQAQQAELERSAQQQRWQEAERNRSYQLAQVESQKQQIEMQLIDLAAVRAPWEGVIQRVKWTGQNDQNLIVELTLVGIAGSTSPNPARPELSK